MTQTTAKVGRPSKGPRRKIGVTVPKYLGDNIERLHKLTGRPMNDHVLDVLLRHADELDPDKLNVAGAQTRLDIDEKKTA